MIKLSTEDYRALEEFLYPAGWPGMGLLRLDLRINERNMRAYWTGRTAVPPTVAAYLIGRVALRLTLKGWADEFPPVSAEIRAEILKRLEEAQRHADQAHQAGR